ncbi:SDR family NAD(P)-dependent oxidoreductase [Actinokineospora sp. PR83]|uniref:SDR family NAD(P)-dependent oxidoreductase n=1 Tax=Actinokineospora sp. PR83 TaxID=2884908 RepID=UPI001F4193C6|nr:SDR family NAD(P)-dependent oxidoreductase [Actinokineospora sp. PR83]MCG8915258.1 SDR family NAD(P)-dependent oxidoreductase [Actinokineospora sp. PR83]
MRVRELLLDLRSGGIGVEEAKAVLAVGPVEATAPAAAEPLGSTPEPIAIIGMAGRYPGAGDLDAFWANLRDGRDSVVEVPAGRWGVAAHDAPRPPDHRRRVGALSGVDLFDADFFGIRAEDAHAMDPQQRLFLQEAYRAFEDAGYGPDVLDGRSCGVYLGIAAQEYGAELTDRQPTAAHVTGTSAAVAAARIAYHLNLLGPALAVDTACTSSLVAVHLACQALRACEVDLALTGGVSLYLGSERHLTMSAAGMLSPTGRCRPFDDGADGFVPGEGVGALVLKRLSDAERDGDAVHGVVLASGVNQNGSTNGLTSPSKRRQTALLRQVYRRHGVDPASIGYVEAHATGTLLGDCIEHDALAAVFREAGVPVGGCAVGSVKGNIGHATAAAGVAAVHKALLCLRHGELVPTPHFEKPNRHLDLAASPFTVTTRTTPWRAPAGGRRRVAVGGLGFSGSNAHLVVEEHRAPATPVEPDQPRLFVLSAADADRLDRAISRLADFLRAEPGVDLASVAHTLQVGRAALPERAAFVAATRDELLGALTARRSAPAGAVPAAAELRALLAAGSLDRVARAWVGGADLSPEDWAVTHAGRPPRRVHLPSDPFAARRYWWTELPPRAVVPGPVGLPTGDRAAVAGAGVAGPAIEYRADDPFVREHVVHGVPALIGMVYASLAVDWYSTSFPGAAGVEVRRLRFLKPLTVGPDEVVEVRVEPADTGFRVSHRDGGDWSPVADGAIREGTPVAREIPQAGAITAVDTVAVYARNPAVAVGPTYRTFTELSAGPDLVLATVDATAAVRRDPRHHLLHPLLTYSAFQAALLFLAAGEAFLPLAIDELRVARDVPDGPVRLAVVLRRRGDEVVVFDADLADEHGRVFATLTGCSLKRVRARRAEPREGARDLVTGKVAALLGVAEDEVDPGVNLMDMGATSAQLVALTDDLGRETGLELSPALLFEYPNVQALADHLHRDHGLAPARQPSREPRPARTAPVDGSPADDHDIAIIGVHAAVPGAADLDEFWRNLLAGRSAVTEVPLDHWDVRPWYDPQPGAVDKTCCKWGGFLPDVAAFDAGFFHVSPREAEWMDPQLRLVLQSAYAAAEDAGVAGRLRGSDTAVFVGVCCHDYLDRVNELGGPVEPYAGLGNNHTVLANRISFALDLRGPSEAVDTACSSSLVALHRACGALRAGEAGMAIVGGVNLLLSSHHYRFFSGVGALSPTGGCHTFDESADGYVPGEFVGSVVLKPLRRAEVDGDRIHAVIKGSAALHGGYTASFTAPSVPGEENVILRAWRDAAVDPATITYVEAHGTGTRLGDPIEVKALAGAFARHTDREGFCALGSVKTAVGHTEGAAGLASLVRVLLQFRHRAIPPAPLPTGRNRLIRLEGTALRLDGSAREWTTPDGVPRRAGISSFGISGAYAHVVVEEYRHGAAPAHDGAPVPILLSARDGDRLRERAAQLADALGAFGDGDLADIAHTLATGREGMRERLGVVVGSVAELAGVLRAVAAGEFPQGVHHGAARVTADAVATAPPGAVAPGADALDLALAAWVTGAEWTVPSTGRIVSLPTYPFAQERYWLPEPVERPGRAPGAAVTAPAARHPLLTVDQPVERVGDEVRVRTSFTGEEFFLTDHRVAGRPVLPGAAHLELVRAAVSRAWPGYGGPAGHVRLSEVVWPAPLDVGDSPVAVEVVMTRRGDEVAFEVRVGDTTCCRGAAHPTAGDDGTPVDVAAVSAACDRLVLPADACYRVFDAAGVDYGPTFRCLRRIAVGTGEVLAELALPAGTPGPDEGLTLHPGLLDSALQATVGLLPDLSEPLLPFAVDAVDVLGPCTGSMWAWVRDAGGGGGVRLFDVDLCDAGGEVRVRVRGISARAARTDHEEMTTMLAVPVWDIVRPSADPVVESGPTVVLGGDATARVRLARAFPGARLLDLSGCRVVEDLRALLAAHPDVDHVVWSTPATGTWPPAEDSGPNGVLQLFQLVKALLALGHGDRALRLTAVTAQAVSTGRHDPVVPTHAGIHGLAASVAAEHPDWDVRVVDLPIGEPWPVEQLRAAPAGGLVHVWRSGQWRRRKLVPARSRSGRRPTGYRHGALYVVIGGAGGIGQAWTEYVAHAYGARVVWIGRRERDARIDEAIDRVARFGPAPYYLRADARDERQLRRALAAVHARFGEVNGVVHAAIALRDRTVAEMSEERFLEAYSTKFDVAAALGAVFAGEPLDFALFFSSVVSHLTAPGQANYAAGCTAKDAVAERLARDWACPVKVVHWGYWGGVGVVATSRYQERMARAGIGSVEPDEAMAALELLLRSPVDRLAVVRAFPSAVPFIDRSEEVVLDAPAWAGRVPGDVPALLDELRDLANEQVGGKIRSSDEVRQLSDYGLAPADLAELARRVGDRYRVNLAQAVFIDHPTLPDLARHLVGALGGRAEDDGGGRR